MVNYASGLGLNKAAKSSGSKHDRGRHLYVFQDSAGMIKVGRSGNPTQRRRTLELASGKKLTTVMVLHDRGVDETALKKAVADYQKTGEWYDGSNACRKAIEAFIQCELKWPLPLPQHVAKWREATQRAEVEALAQAYVERLTSTPPRKAQAKALAEGATDLKRAHVRAGWHNLST